MTVLSAEDIYRVARGAGFTPDQAVTFTAIAMAESSGRSDALASKGEHSIGLWQINVAANVRRNSWGDLTDPATNARAAYEISRSGTYLRPWTVTHDRNADTPRDYRRYLDEATAARTTVGDAPVAPPVTAAAPTPSAQSAPIDADRDGVTDTVEVELGRSPLEADPGDAIGQAAAAAYAAHPMAGANGTASGDQGVLDRFLSIARAQAGDRYVWGSEPALSDNDPEAFDCSELVQWAAHQAGVKISDGAMYQYLEMKKAGALIPVEEAKNTPGALLFYFSREPQPGGSRPDRAHVAISLGDGNTIEARGKAYGVAEFEAGDRFTYAAVVPGLTGAAGTLPAGATTPSYDRIDPGLSPWLLDQDGDGLVDGAEVVSKTSPTDADTDDDGASDSAEVLVAHTDPLDADSDDDTYEDGTELAFGSDPLVADSTDPWAALSPEPAPSSGRSDGRDSFGVVLPAPRTDDHQDADLIRDLMT